MSAEKKPGEYLLNYLTLVPGTLEAVYETVALQGPVTLNQCRDLLLFRSEGDADEDHVLTALNFLEANDVVARDGELYRAPFGPLPVISFRAQLIKGLYAQSGKQADFMRIYDLLVRAGRTSIEVGPLMGFLDENKFVTVGVASVNDFKLGFWMRLMDYLGVVHQVTRSKSVTLTPHCGLVLHLIREAAAGSKECSVPRFLEGLEKDYFPVTTRRGELHPGVGAAVVHLRDMGNIGLTTKSDAPAIKLSSVVTASHITLKEGELDV